nr:glycosyltransferase family 4 protein [Micromonospora sp. DSM 115978]
MRVVLIHRYFWPDSAPYAHILRQLALRLGEDGHEVEILTCQPSYRPPAGPPAPRREKLGDRVTVRRWPVVPDRRYGAAKVVNLVLFCAWLLTTGVRLGRADVVLAASTPPVAVARVASFIARRCRARFVYHKQDIYPDVMVAAGLFRAARLSAILRRIDARTDRRADRVVVLSRDMAETVRGRGVRPDRIAVINNFDPWSSDPGSLPMRDRPGRRPGDPLRVVFAGNLGRFQNLETVVAALTRLADEPLVTTDFFGDGPARGFVEREIARHGLDARVHGYRPPDEVARFLRREADLGIVSLLPGMIRAAYPSRTLSYLRHGCPVLALVERESELAEMIVDARAGVQVDPTSVDQLAETLRSLAHRPGALAGAHHRAGALYDRFRAERQLDRWTELFDRLGGRRQATGSDLEGTAV